MAPATISEASSLFVAADNAGSQARCRQGKRLGRPGAEPEKPSRARRELAKGIGVGKVARIVGLGTGTVHRLKCEMAAR